MGAISAHGTVIKRNGVAISELRDVTPPVLGRSMSDRTTHGDVIDIAQRGFRKLGELTFSIGLVIGDPTHLGLFTAYGDDTVDSYEIDFPDGATWFFNGYVVDLGEVMPVGGLLAVQVVVHVTGAITFSATPTGDFLLQETGDMLLLETGDSILLDA